jgi:hypothetical protein
MGAYGSPQVGYFAELEEQQRKNRKAPHSNKPWIIIVAIVITIVLSKNMRIEDNINTVNNLEESKIIGNDIKAIDKETESYLQYSKQIKSEIKNLLESSYSETGLQNINIVDMQSYIRKYTKEVEKMKNINIDKRFNEYKDYTYNSYKSILEILQNYINSNNYNIKTVNLLGENYNEMNTKELEILKKILKENDFTYEEIIIDDKKGVKYYVQ